MVATGFCGAQFMVFLPYQKDSLLSLLDCVSVIVTAFMTYFFPSQSGKGVAASQSSARVPTAGGELLGEHEVFDRRLSRTGFPSPGHYSWCPHFEAMANAVVEVLSSTSPSLVHTHCFL